MNITGQAKVGGVQNLVGAGVVQDGLGVNAGLVGEGAEASDRVVERRVDLYGLGNHIFNLVEELVKAQIRIIPLTHLLYHVEFVLALDVVWAGNNHPRHESTKRSNTVTLSNPKHTGIDMGCTCL